MRTAWKQNAAHCLEAMQATANPEIRAMLLSMAERWARRAEQAECRPDAMGAGINPTKP